jgi:hypothetical protein
MKRKIEEKRVDGKGRIGTALEHCNTNGGANKDTEPPCLDAASAIISGRSAGAALGASGSGGGFRCSVCCGVAGGWCSGGGGSSGQRSS